MNWDSTSTLRSQLRAIAEAKNDIEAYRMLMDPDRCCVGAYRLVVEYRKPDWDIREAAKRAEGSL